VKAAIGASAWSRAALVSHGIMKFAFVMGLAREEVITILVGGRLLPQMHFVLMRAGGRIGKQRQWRRESW
jgi:hypothetical protein